jgi:hypothetical protein
MQYAKILGSLVALSSLTACYSATANDFARVELPNPIETEARERVSYTLKDTTSAQVRNIRGFAFSGPGGGYVVCGEVNGRNSYGGYAGFQPFRTNVGNLQSPGNVYVNDFPAVSTPC